MATSRMNKRRLIATWLGLSIVLSVIPNWKWNVIASLGWPFTTLEFYPIQFFGRMSEAEYQAAVGNRHSPQRHVIWIKAGHGKVYALNIAGALGAIGLAAIFPAAAGVRAHLVRRRRTANGCCRVCGYDLRGSLNERCSECGTGAAHVDSSA